MQSLGALEAGTLAFVDQSPEHLHAVTVVKNEENQDNTQQNQAETDTSAETKTMTRSGSSNLNSLLVGDKAYFAWSEVSFKLSAKAVGKSKKDPMVLKQIKGHVAPGEVVAIMGSSGSGKTSLLNVLSGRSISMNGHEVTGKFTINGQPISPSKMGSKVAFVTQEDTLCPTATPREALGMSARLRLPPTVTAEQRQNMVNDVIRVLRLEKCADTMIGDDLIKGISGGEKRRTSIGVELITSPSILFLDEPTSGLDSYGAFMVVNVLKDLASAGCAILCTIHQPSSEVFHLFDRALLMVQGRLMYSDPVARLGQFLSSVGHPIPHETNPADHVMFLMQTLEREKLAEMCDTHEAEEAKVDPHQVPAHLAQASAVESHMLVRRQAGLLAQFGALATRELRNMVRDKRVIGARLGMTSMLNILFGVIFLHVGDTSRGEYTIGSHFGALVMVGVSSMMGSAQPVLLLFPAERPRFLREYATGTYSAAAYFVSKLATELPLSFLTSLLSFIICYWMLELKGNFILLVLSSWLLGLGGASTALFFGCLASSAQEAMQAAPAVFVPQMLFAGLFVRLEQIPVWIRWAQYLCSLKYGISLFEVVEFQPGSAACSSPSQQKGCDGLLASNEVNLDIWWAYVLVLLAIFLGFRLLGLIVLVRKARGFALA